MDILSKVEVLNLLKKESFTHDEVQCFKKVANALQRLRDKRLYKKCGDAHFEEYCQKSWGFSENYANRLIYLAQSIQIEVIGYG